MSISGILLFTCPLFITLTFYDLMVRRFIEHHAVYPPYGIGPIVVLGICIAAGVWMGRREWSERAVAEK